MFFRADNILTSRVFSAVTINIYMFCTKSFIMLIVFHK